MKQQEMSFKIVFFTNFRGQQPSLSSEMFTNESTSAKIHKNQQKYVKMVLKRYTT